MAIVPPIICSVPDPDESNPAAGSRNGQQSLPGFLQIPSAPPDKPPVKIQPPPLPFPKRLTTGQKFERHLMGYLHLTYPEALFLPARSDQFNGAPSLHGFNRTLIQPDITMFDQRGPIWWECKFRHDVHTWTDSQSSRQLVSISLRHWKHYWKLWEELCYPFYIVFAIARQDVVVYAPIEALHKAIVIIDPRPYHDASGTVYFAYDALTQLLSFSEFVKF